MVGEAACSGPSSPLAEAVRLRPGSCGGPLLPGPRLAAGGSGCRGADAPGARRRRWGRRWRRRMRSWAWRARRWVMSKAPSPRTGGRSRSIRRNPMSATAWRWRWCSRASGARRRTCGPSLARDAAMRATARLNLGMSQLQRGDLAAAVATYRALIVGQPGQRRGLLQPRHGAEAAGRVRRGRACAAPGLRAGRDPARSAVHARRVVVADGPRRGSRRLVRQGADDRCRASPTPTTCAAWCCRSAAICRQPSTRCARPSPCGPRRPTPT